MGKGMQSNTLAQYLYYIPTIPICGVTYLRLMTSAPLGTTTHYLILVNTYLSIHQLWLLARFHFSS